ncbi:protein P21-like [Aegilops tauschii subsp. strangulata]|nr:protein P21-like [Aegilops tauschii subsp. strangulata]
MASSLTLILALLLAIAATTDAITVHLLNKCPYTVWPGAYPVGGGSRLDTGQAATIQVPPGTAAGRIWGRTGCNFDASGRGSCTTGDCGGVLACAAGGRPPATLAEYTLGKGGSPDFYDISLVDGFNVPMSFGPAGGGFHAISCAADINANCPSELKVDGGCVSACVKFGAPQYCCMPPLTPSTCGPTDYSRFFKGHCPDAYSYAYDDKSSTFTCPVGSDYQVTFCP